MKAEGSKIYFTKREVEIIESTMEDELSDLLNNKDIFPRARKYYEYNHDAIENIIRKVRAAKYVDIQK